ncbi:MAG: DUF5060 domain-containing protein [Armatimonadetes bacterium]|nr:DUF5060 domain-containing protein [Armatimonadota bacterium]
MKQLQLLGALCTVLLLLAGTVQSCPLSTCSSSTKDSQIASDDADSRDRGPVAVSGRYATVSEPRLSANTVSDTSGGGAAGSPGSSRLGSGTYSVAWATSLEGGPDIGTPIGYTRGIPGITDGQPERPRKSEGPYRPWWLPPADIEVAADLSEYDDYVEFESSGSWDGSVIGTFDRTPPEGLVIIEDGAEYTDRVLVRLTFEAEDSLSEVAYMRLSNDATNWTDWDSYASETFWNLARGDGEKTVYAQFQDEWGNISLVCSDSIILDATEPQFLGITAAPSEVPAGARVRIAFAVSEKLAGSPVVTVNDRPASLSGSDGDIYTFSYLTVLSDAESPATIAISGTDFMGNIGSVINTTALYVTPPAEDIPVPPAPTPPPSTPNAPVIWNLSDNTGTYDGGFVPKYDKYELTFRISNVGTAFVDYNPFNPNTARIGSGYYNLRGILVDGNFTAPDGSSMTHPAFWYGSGTWKLRFAPNMAGVWRVWLSAATSEGAGYSDVLEFSVTDQTTNSGFIRVNPDDPRFFQFEDETPFYPIGTGLSGFSGGGADDAAVELFPKMQFCGANFARDFHTSTNIEPYNVGTDKSRLKALNNYNMERAKAIDTALECAREYGIYVEWLIDDWTYIKDSSNQYVRASGREAPCADVEEFFARPEAREIYKRKLRYWIARWGYCTNLFAIELMNELGGGGSGAKSWHVEMGDYIHSFTAQPHFATSSNGSAELREGGGIPWTDEAMDFVNYHDYAKYTGSWLVKSDYDLEKLGFDFKYPWIDTAVWADRVARMHFKRYGWNKPIIWSEFGLIYRRPGDDGFPDWKLAYRIDTDARHLKDCMWAGMLAGMGVIHWKADFVNGYYGGGDKFRIFVPLANFLLGEDFSGLKQETAYPVYDETNPEPTLTCSNKRVMVVSMHGPDRAYLYVKNLTNTWYYNYRIKQSGDNYAGYTPVPNPLPQSAEIRVYGLQPGDYVVEEWSTSESDPVKQIVSTQTITVPAYGPDAGVASIYVENLNVDAAYKIK